MVMLLCVHVCALTFYQVDFASDEFIYYTGVFTLHGHAKYTYLCTELLLSKSTKNQVKVIYKSQICPSNYWYSLIYVVCLVFIFC